METGFYIGIIIGVVVFIIKQLNKVTDDTPAILSNNEVELVVNLNIKSQTDLQKIAKNIVDFDMEIEREMNMVDFG
ncbi:hypothetical protein [Aliarcobacter cryaerophilus]|uniref:hypothetical protein n=1 Tax=Aliarcobacter cryaerophilus TaxID=28198 RepID=UPI00112F7014|nr:hypothetical protein [Aliarcobacter cryaerophilus]